MAEVTLYHSNPVCIPEAVPIKRSVPFLRSEVTGKRIPDAEYANFDTETIFYDVLILPGGQQAVALGPPLHNLRKSILPLKIICAGIQVGFTQRSYKKLWQILFTIPRSLIGKSFDLEFSFTEFSVLVRLLPRDQQIIKHDFALTTLQKDNEAHWIADWCQWHYKLYGISDFLLYDNDSRTFGKIKKALEDLDLPIQVKIICWPFRHGTPSSWRNRFSQTGSLNHARICFGPIYKWMLNLDIDEYLAIGNNVSLKDLLSRLPSHCTIILFGFWNVPAHKNKDSKDFRSVADYTFREIVPITKFTKYMFKPDLTTYNLVHYAYPKSIWLCVSIWYDLYAGIMHFLYISMPRHLSKRPLLEILWPFEKKVQYYLHRNMCFYHFRGLNTDWRIRSRSHSQSKNLDPTLHVMDSGLRSMLKKAGIKNTIYNNPDE